ncbi:MAG: glycosyltransferase [Verrucomicrobiota bacterium]
MSKVPLVTVALASRNEVAMLVMTVISSVEAFRAAGVHGEVLVVDNSDEAVHAAVRSALAGQMKDGVVRLLREESPSIAVTTDRAHREARGEHVLYFDSHCLLGAGTLEKMLDFFARHSGEPIGFLHAPIQWAHMSSGSRMTHFQVNRTRMGEWAGAKRVKEEQRVTWKGMPHMIRRETYEKIGGLGCCAEHRLGWGIMRYLGMKPWLLGYENWAIPEGVVYHFGEWPDEVKPFAQYRNYHKSGEGRVGSALAVAAYAFGGEDFLRSEYEAQMKPFFPSADAALAAARRLGEAERQWMLSNQVCSINQLFSNPPWATL